MLFFFFSSRRRHTRFDCDWSSDVCSSDLPAQPAVLSVRGLSVTFDTYKGPVQVLDDVSFDIRSEERRVGKSVDLGGRRIIKKKKKREYGKTYESKKER